MNNLFDLYRQGLELFREHRFWEAHEKWEEFWQQVKASKNLANKSDLVKGIIQISAAFHKIYKQKNIEGFRKIIHNLKKYLKNYPQILFYLELFSNDPDIIYTRKDLFHNLITQLEKIQIWKE
ncbi:MAG: DUF309 domain-containing protein [Candidatus Calescibacterium sp.]|nr:DUF309 domain-containing protein [Candidatus Calescibacterium sp.]MCX7972055.1 DUF309 domain-containing protein [bacterium]MDW8194661.1 DUF309 domain-containing protein [Candidatus Calescibacterium sp.]